MAEDQKDYAEVTIFMEKYRVTGRIYTKSSFAKGRITDIFNDPEKKFVPVLDAKIYLSRLPVGGDSKFLYDEPLLLINRDFVVSVRYKKPEEKWEKK